MPISLGELATRYGCELDGDPELVIDNVASLERAGSRSLGFYSNLRMQQQLAATKAAAVVLRRDDAGAAPCAALISDDPYLSFARIARFLNPLPALRPGTHATAVVDPAARVAASAELGAHVVVEANAVIGEHVLVGPGSYVGPDCVIGDECRLLARVTLVRQVEMGARCIIHPGAVIGSDGFGNAPSPEGWVKVPQLGGVTMGDDVEIGANSTIDCGALEDTAIGDGVRIDNLCMVAHNVSIGSHTALASMVGIAGSAVIGRHCLLGGQAGVAGHLSVCDGVMVNGQGMISKSITEPGAYASSFPVDTAREWNKAVARFRRLDSLYTRVKKLERRDQ